MGPWATNIGDTYLEALMSEKVCIRDEPDFGDLEGHLFINYKELYGLKLSGKEFCKLLQECLLELELLPSLAEASIYMRKCSTTDHYGYVATCIDNLTIIMKDLQVFLDQL